MMIEEQIRIKIHEVFKAKINEIVKEEIKNATDRVEKRITDEVALIGLRVDHLVRVDMHEQNIVITLQKKFPPEVKA